MMTETAADPTDPSPFPPILLWTRSAEGDLRNALEVILEALGAIRGKDYPSARLALITAGEAAQRAVKEIEEALR